MAKKVRVQVVTIDALVPIETLSVFMITCDLAFHIIRDFALVTEYGFRTHCEGDLFIFLIVKYCLKINSY